VAISDFELELAACISVLVLVVFLLLYKELFYIALDEQGARLAGVSVGAINVAFTILTAITVSVAARTVGALIVSSLMVIPVACAMQFGKSYRQTVIFSICFAVVFMTVGLTLSFYLSLRTGGTIVLTGVITLLLILFGKQLAKHRGSPDSEKVE
jgi:zinc transport system permease protein